MSNTNVAKLCREFVMERCEKCDTAVMGNNKDFGLLPSEEAYSRFSFELA